MGAGSVKIDIVTKAIALLPNKATDRHYASLNQTYHVIKTMLADSA